jgi:predicted alpha/beta-hydrolase family hydrolase
MLELATAQTADGLRLHGALRAGACEPSPGADVDAWLLLHGTGGSFYSSSLLDVLAETLVAQGAAALLANTRGHDLAFAAATHAGVQRFGAAYEKMADCRFDLFAWISLLVDRGHPRIGLLGHSLGAVKALYAQASRPHPNVRRVVAVSPPRLSHAWFLSSSKAKEFFETLQAAELEIRQGRPQALLDVRFPLPFLCAAETYVDKYGPEERYNVVPLLSALRVPTLLTWGEREVAENVAFQGLPEAAAKVSGPNVRVTTIAGADHFYSAARAGLTAALLDWLRG